MSGESTDAFERAFTYDAMTGRNAGFVTADEQARLRAARVLVIGTGGMGGAALQSLVRAGVGAVTIADMDDFEVSNLNRQVFATRHTVGKPKVASTADALRDINPSLDVTALGAEWTDRLDVLLATHKLVVNGMDDAAAGIHLYRRAREHGATVIDAYTSPLPSVTVVRPRDPRPEERLGFPTLGTDWRALTAEQLDQCKLAEAVYVLVHSPSARYIDLGIAAEMMAGKRARPSFAPMVITTGNLMAFAAVAVLLDRPFGADYRGVFFDPWRFRVAGPRHPAVAAPLAVLARRMIRRLMAGS